MSSDTYWAIYITKQQLGSCEKSQREVCGYIGETGLSLQSSGLCDSERTLTGAPTVCALRPAEEDVSTRGESDLAFFYAC